MCDEALYQIQLIQKLKKSTDYKVAVELVSQDSGKLSASKEQSELLFFTADEFKKLQQQVRAYEESIRNK